MNASQSTHQIGSTNNNLTIMSRSSGDAGPSEVKGTDNDTDFARIEELIKGNTFSREEISRLLEVLNSRVEVESEKNTSSRSAGADGQQFSLLNEIPRTPIAEKPQEPDRSMVRAFLEITDVPVGVGASPIDIARAFMAGRTAKQSRDPHSCTLTGERTQLSNDLARSQLLQSPSPKSSTCWPGAVVHGHHGYITPQSQRTRYGPRDFPRTLYSRTSLSKSTAKSQADSMLTSSLTPFPRSQASIFGQVRSRGETVDADGSGGPIRRIRNKFAAEARPRRSFHLNSGKDIALKPVNPNVFSGFLPTTENNQEPGETSGASKTWPADKEPSSSDGRFSTCSEAAKLILEQLNRNTPTPKAKEEELKLATAWRKSFASETSNTIQEENMSSMQRGESSSRESTGITGTGIFSGSTKHSSIFSSSLKFQNRGMDEATAAGNDTAKISGSSVAIASSSSAIPPFGLKGNTYPVVNNIHEQKETSLQFARPLSNGKDVKSAAGPGSEPPKNHGTKPPLQSILINKRPRPVPSDNGPGFSFPISASSGGLSEPPTPSMLPSSSVSMPSQPQGFPRVPSYNFGTNKSTPPLVFSFPLSSNGSSPEASGINYTFGSNGKNRLSFSSSICR